MSDFFIIIKLEWKKWYFPVLSKFMEANDLRYQIFFMIFVDDHN